jgi:hypothetical protein
LHAKQFKLTQLSPLSGLFHCLDLLLLLAFVPILVGVLLLEVLPLKLRQLVEHHLQPRERDLAVLI